MWIHIYLRSRDDCSVLIFWTTFPNSMLWVNRCLEPKNDMLSDIWQTLLYTGCTFNLGQFHVALLPVPNVYPCFEGLHYLSLLIFWSTSFFSLLHSVKKIIIKRGGEFTLVCVLQNTVINIKHACYFDYILMIKVKFHRNCIIWLLCSA